MRTARDALEQQLAASLLAVHRLQGGAAAAQSEAQTAKYVVTLIALTVHYSCSTLLCELLHAYSQFVRYGAVVSAATIA